MGRWHQWQKALRRAVVCLTFVLVVSLYLASLRHTSPLPGTMPRQGPTAQEHPTRDQIMPLLGTLPTNTSHPITLNCSHGPGSTSGGWRQYLRRASHAEQAGARDTSQDEWQEAVSAGAPLHECPVEVEVRPCMCRRTVTALLPSPCPASSPHRLLQHIKATLGESTCGDLATLRGAAQKVVSYSLGGAAREIYREGLTLVVPQIQEMYPGWSMRVYIDNTSAPYPWACPLACQYPHLDFCDVARLPGLGNVSRTHPGVWRFAVFGDRLVRRYMLRDADSPVLRREVAAVDQWLRGGRCYHIMRDHPDHNVPILAGMFGGCTSWRHTAVVAAREAAFCTPLKPSGDQEILRILLWPTVKHNVTMHDSYICRKYPSAVPFPTQRVNFTFVGMRTYRRRYWWDRITAECPRACRPREHQNWKHC